jgi:hypothetical protein
MRSARAALNARSCSRAYSPGSVVLGGRAHSVSSHASVAGVRPPSDDQRLGPALEDEASKAWSVLPHHERAAERLGKMRERDAPALECLRRRREQIEICRFPVLQMKTDQRASTGYQETALACEKCFEY